MIRSISDIESILTKQAAKKRIVLAAAQDEYAMSALIKAHQKGYVEAVLVGNLTSIEQLASTKELSLKGVEIIHESDLIKSVEIAVKQVHLKHADILMKGACSTAILLKAVLNKDWGLRKGKLLSHLSLFELPRYHKLLGISDVAINIAPNTSDKIEILRNAIEFMQSLGISTPKVAIVAAVEKVSDSMPITIEAANLTQHFKENEVLECLVDGPLALDTAINSESAKHKGIQSLVAGDADLLLMPQIEAGNILYKSLSFLAFSKVAAVVLGASAPIVLTSRSDSEESKLNSIMLAAVGKTVEH